MFATRTLRRIPIDGAVHSKLSGFGSGLEVLQVCGVQVSDAGFALPETYYDHYNGGQGAEKLFLVLTLLSCLHESCMVGSTLLNSGVSLKSLIS